VLSLMSLAGWEEAVLASLRGASGTLEERDRQIERSGLFGEYPAILGAYVELFADAESAAEALKRATFLVWRASMAPSATTGIASLPDATARAVIEALDAHVRGGRVDGELAWMLAWYAAGGRFVLELYGATTRLLAFADSTPFDAWRSQSITDDTMRLRGQMGHYWIALAKEAGS
jgi:hypothetical protein